MPMQHVFSFTLAEAWAFLIYAAGAAAGLYAGGVAISKVITAIKKPKADQDKRITKLEERVNAMEGFLKNDKLRLDRMDEGQLSDAEGERVDFRNTVIVMTCNLGAEAIRGRQEIGRAHV